MPSAPVLAILCALVAVIGWMLVRPGGDRAQAELATALERTLDRGGPYTGVAEFITPESGPMSRTFEGMTAPGTPPYELADERAVMGNLELLGEVRVVGEESIAGATTTHYAATVDPELQAERSAERLEANGVEIEIDVAELQDRPPQIDVWIDDAGLIRRFYVSESYKDGALQASTTIDLGAPVAAAGNP